MPTTRNDIIKYGLAAINDALVTIPPLIKRTVAMGISNAMPKAKTSLNIKLRYWFISVMTWIESGAIPIKNLNIIGHTTKNAKLTPQKNKRIVEIIKGAVNLLSLSYNPGATNIHIWKKSQGIENNKAT